MQTTIERITAEPCAVVHSNACTAPPGIADPDGYPEPGEGTRARCYSCGEPACLSCSTVRLYYGARRRICATCEPQRFEDGEARVLLRDYHRAGYPGMTLAKVRAELASYAR